MKQFAFLIFPIYYAGKWSLNLSRARGSAWWGGTLFAVTVVLVLAICAYEMPTVHAYEQKEMWTAATMTVCKAAIEFGVVFCACYYAHWRAWPNKGRGP